MNPRINALLGLILLIASGCTGLPARTPLPESESIRIGDNFRQMLQEQGKCSSNLDADLTVTIDSRLYTGTMNGFLQAMVPSYLKIVGTNPFGQPLVILVTDGRQFRYALLNEFLSYEGDVGGDSFKRYAPAGFDPSTSFYSLIGRLPPGQIRIVQINGDPDGRGAWLQIDQGNNRPGSLLLFDPERQVILKHIQLDKSGDITMEIFYSDHQLGECILPGKISISSRGHSGNLVLRLNNWQTEESASAAEFEFELPPAFTRVQVK